MLLAMQTSYIIISHTTEGVDGDFMGTTCMVTFANGSGPGAVSTPPCNIAIIDDSMVEQRENFSLSATVINSNGLTVQFTAGGDSASGVIIDDDGMLILAQLLLVYGQLKCLIYQYIYHATADEYILLIILHLIISIHC